MKMVTSSCKDGYIWQCKKSCGRSRKSIRTKSIFSHSHASLFSWMKYIHRFSQGLHMRQVDMMLDDISNSSATLSKMSMKLRHFARGRFGGAWRRKSWVFGMVEILPSRKPVLRYNIVLFGAVDGYSRKDIEEPDIDWDAAADYGEDVDGVIVVPEFECPLNEQQLVELQVLIEENGDTDTTDLYLLCHEYVLQALSGV
ncbi:hypothetical protein ROHU_001727 [Labeo rohita]|uniref:Uncharacterized protein n=1 Tax=Labeo rohita TaxID=84645 RepID=A0A498P2X0_LABRO|nr:hypothetical protein ROHU_001727 [Labeo rohita]